MIFAIAPIIVFVIGFGVYSVGQDSENWRLRQKCLVEMESKPHKEAIEVCKERVK